MARYNMNYYESDLEYITSHYPDTTMFEEMFDEDWVHIETGMTRAEYLKSDEYADLLHEYVIQGGVADHFCAPADFY